MIALVMVLVAFPAGFFMRSWLAANVVYIAAFAWAYSYQGLYLALFAMEGPGEEAEPFPWEYGVITLAIYGVGFGLVALGHRLGARRRSRRGTQQPDPEAVR